MSVFEQSCCKEEHNGVVHLFEQPKAIVSYNFKPLFSISQRIIRNPVTEDQQKECNSFFALPFLGQDTFVLLGPHAERFKWIMETFEKWFPNVFQMPQPTESFLRTTETAIKKSKVLYTVPVRVEFQELNIRQWSLIFAKLFLMHYFVWLTNSVWQNFDSLFTRSLLNPLTKSPKNDFEFDLYYSIAFGFSVLYQCFWPRKQQDTVNPTYYYQQMHNQPIRVEQEELRGASNVVQNEGENVDAENDEQNFQDSMDSNEQDSENSGSENDSENEISQENSINEEAESNTDSEEFIECDRSHEDQENVSEQHEYDDTEKEIDNLLEQREAMGHDISEYTTNQLVHLKDSSYEVFVNIHNVTILVVQWQSEHGTRGIILQCNRYFLPRVGGAILNGILFPLTFMFLARCLYSIVFSSIILQLPFDLLYGITSNYWLTKHCFILCVLLLQNHFSKRHILTARFALHLLTRNIVFANFVSMFIASSFHQWSIINTIHFYWIMQFFNVF